MSQMGALFLLARMGVGHALLIPYFLFQFVTSSFGCSSVCMERGGNDLSMAFFCLPVSLILSWLAFQKIKDPTIFNFSKVFLLTAAFWVFNGIYYSWLS